jgi:hypothetical protein
MTHRGLLGKLRPVLKGHSKRKRVRSICSGVYIKTAREDPTGTVAYAGSTKSGSGEIGFV